MAYINTFLYLSEGYQKALASKEWYNIQNEEEFYEYATFVSSVANDAHKMRSDQVLSLARMDVSEEVCSSTELSDLISRTLQTFDMVNVMALDQFSCILFMFTFHSKQDLLRGGFLSAWQQSLADGEECIKFFRSIVEDLLEFIHDYEVNLDQSCIVILKHICAGKAVLILLSIIKEARAAGLSFETRHSFIVAFCNECIWLKATLERLLFHTENIEYNWIRTPLHFFDCYVQLLQAELGSAQLDKALTTLAKGLEHASPVEKDAQVNAIHACMSLRGIRKFFSPEQSRPARKPSKPVTPKMDIMSSPSPVSPEKKEKRGSILSFFNNIHLPHGHTSHTAESTHHTQSSTMSEDHCNDDDSEASLVKQMLQQKEEALVACVESCINQILAPSASLERPKLPLFSYLPVAASPVTKMFGSDSQPIEVLLIYSAARTSTREGNHASGKTEGFGIGTFFTSMLAITAGTGGLLKNKFATRRGSATSNAKEIIVSRPDSVAVPVLQDSTPTQLPAGDPELYIIIKDLQVSDLFYLDYFRAPRPYFRVRVGNYSVKTSVKEGSNTSVDWLDEQHLELPIYTVSSSTLELEIALHYEGYLADNLVATLRMSFDPHSPPGFTNKRYGFSEFAEKAQTALQRAKTEGRSLPSLSFSMLSA
ncbi:hypothetical protein EON65_20500 [archaeon]|nr:MAG: hypothetical protein EON65_20500 [archaeon]